MKRAIVAIAAVLFALPVFAIKLQLTDADIKEIVELSKDRARAEQVLKSYMKDNSYDKKRKSLGAATLQSKYNRVLDYAIAQNSKYLPIEQPYIDKINSLNSVGFYVLATGKDIDFLKYTHVVLKQGDKIIQPTQIMGKNEIPRPYASFWSGTLTAIFFNDDISPDTPSELIIINTATGNEIKLPFDLGVYK